jgi:hypothetical protein
MNDYLLGTCFNPDHGENNLRHFANYMLLNLTRIDMRRGFEYVSATPEMTKVLYENRLVDYWTNHGEQIKSMGLENEDIHVRTANYVANYKDYLPPLYRLLDEMAANSQKAGAVTRSDEK